MKRLGIINKRGKAITGYRTARKSELQRRARELEYFDQWKGSEKGAVSSSSDYKKYKSFINNPHNKMFANYSYQDWRDLVNTFGAMEDKLVEFEYEDMKRLHVEATRKGNTKTLVSAMEKAQEKAQIESTSRAVSTRDLTKFVREELFI